MTRADTDNYRELFLGGLPLMDTRAPVEFDHGAFPQAVSLPLMNDEERHRVGIRYKEQGQASAIELGSELVAGPLREQRIEQWCNFAREHPGGYLYCFRGGLRSRTVQQWMRDAGVDYPLVLGGYKAMRGFLLEALEASVERARFLLIAGKTGTGKTRVLAALDRAVDLESLAAHRGSTFGQLLDPQPSQIDFENSLGIALLRLLAGAESGIVLEDEGRLIGRLSLPASLGEKMQVSGMLVVEEPLEERIQVILEDYVLDLGERYERAFGTGGAEGHRQQLLDGLTRIRKRLGGVRFSAIAAQMNTAFEGQARDGDTSAHRQWIATLLLEYYDPMYEYQMSKRQGEVIGRGTREEMTALARASIE